MGASENGGVQWDAPLPGPEPAYVPIYRAMVGATTRLIAVCPSIERVHVHWLNPFPGVDHGRTIPCVGPDTGCPCKVFKLRKEWYGYLGAWDPGAERIVIAELTVQAVRESNVDLTGRIVSVRGLPFRMWRRGKRPCSPVRVEFDPREYDGAKLPAPFDVRSCLERIWKVGERPLM